MIENLYDEEEALLDESSSSLGLLEDNRYRCNQHKHRWSYLKTIAILVFATSLTLNIYSLTSYAISSWDDRDAQPFPFSPADQVKSYHTTSINTRNFQSSFIGPPRDEFDRAWSDLLFPTSIRVSADEMRKAGRKSLKLREGEGYLGSMEVYHQLHCVKRIVQSRYPEHYQVLVDHGQLSDSHFDHCIEVLRQGIMCSADTSLNTVIWDPKNLTHMKGVTDGPRKCANWDHLEQWARSRAVGPGHPVLSVGEPGFMGPDV